MVNLARTRPQPAHAQWPNVLTKHAQLDAVRVKV